VTDANLVLGRLDPDYFLGGSVALHPELAEEAVARVGGEIGLDAIAAALALTRTADENMANAIRLIAVERGLDPRDFSLMAFGGAGPLHGRAVADRLDMRTVLIPPHPGLCSAFGVGIANARVDRARTFSARSWAVDLVRLADAERELRQLAVDELRASVGDVAASIVRRAALEAEHERQYGFALEGEPIELINLRATAYVEDAIAAPSAPPVADHDVQTRAVWFGEAPIEDCPVLMRESLAAGQTVEGPAVIQEPDSTTLVWPADVLRVLDSGVLELTIGGAT
jgi:N-methylhydantoinase A